MYTNSSQPDDLVTEVPFTWIFDTGRTEIFRNGLRSEVSYRLHARPVWDTVHPNFRYGKNHRTEKSSTVQKIHLNAKKFQFGVVVALFIGPTITELKRNFFTTGEIFIYEICVNIRPVKVLQQPKPKSKIQPVLKHLM